MEGSSLPLILKALVSLVVILLASELGRRFHSLSGLIAVMPLGGALVLVWVYEANQGDPLAMTRFAKGALWGILPSLPFYLAALYGFRQGWPLFLILGVSFGVWSLGAFLHQWMLRS